MKRLVILGARQHAKVVVAIIKEFYSKQVKIIGYLDDDVQLTGKKILGYPVLGKLADLEKIIKEKKVTSGIVGISNRYMLLRGELYRRLRRFGLQLPTFVHGEAYISKFAVVGNGVVINPGVVINAFARVGNNSVIYSNSAIEHETILGENVYIGPGVSFSSNAHVGPNTFIGAGVKVIPDIVIGSSVIVGAGSVVIKNIPDRVTVVGIPAAVVGSSLKSKL